MSPGSLSNIQQILRGTRKRTESLDFQKFSPLVLHVEEDVCFRPQTCKILKQLKIEKRVWELMKLPQVVLATFKRYCITTLVYEHPNVTRSDKLDKRCSCGWRILLTH